MSSRSEELRILKYLGLIWHTRQEYVALTDSLDKLLEKLNKLTVTTTDGKPFSGQDSARLALLIFRRFGCDSSVAVNKWRHMLGNDCTEEQFLELVALGTALPLNH